MTPERGEAVMKAKGDSNAIRRKFQHPNTVHYGWLGIIGGMFQYSIEGHTVVHQ